MSRSFCSVWVLGVALTSSCGGVSLLPSGTGGDGGTMAILRGSGGTEAAGTGGAAGAGAAGSGGGGVVDAGGTDGGAGHGGAAGGGGGLAGGGGGGSGGHGGGADAGTPTCSVKINEVQTGGTTALDEFIELYNTCPDRAVDLTGYTLVYRAAAGTTDSLRVSFAGLGFVAGKPYLLCANTGFAGTADATYTDGLASAGGALALRDPSGAIVDSVGWGTATNDFVEGTPAAAPPNAQSIARIPDGHDTDDNGADFTVTGATTTPGSAN